jgi:hypothetical protein
MTMVHRNGCLGWILVLLASVPVASRADVVLEWNEIMLATLVGQSPVNEARLAAITQLAVFEAVNSISGDYRPYLRTIKAPRGASADAAVVAAAHATLVHFVPGRIEELDRARAKSLRAIIDGPAKRDGIAVGKAAARALIKLREDDGSAPNESYLPTSAKPGEWQLTTGCPLSGGVFLQWQDVVPFGIKRSGQYRVAPPPALRSDEYAVAYNEVRKVGGVHSSERPQDRADVARFYAAVLTIGTWNPVASQVAAAKGRSLSENARALALLNMALSDGLVAVFKAKYRDPFWRPETAIPAGDRDRNPKTRPDPNFAPFVATPCHPSYPSAHASAAYAAQEILERIYGRKNHLINLSNPLVPGVSLQYRRFDEITADIDDARVFGGIHFRFDQEAGASLGCRVGRYIYRHHLRPAHDRAHDDGRAKDCPR